MLASMMRRLLLLLSVSLLLLSVTIGADEARPVYVEVTQMSDSEYLLKWKIPPVMSQGQEPAIELRQSNCRINKGAVAGKPAGLVGRKLYRCDSNTQADYQIELIYPNSNPALTSLIVFKPLSGDPVQVFSGPEETLVTLSLVTSPAAVAKQYTVAGIEHILIGTDHLLFVLCLMMIAGSFKRLVLTVRCTSQMPATTASCALTHKGLA